MSSTFEPEYKEYMNLSDQLKELLKAKIEEANKSTEIARLYAKNNCRHCLGRGIIKKEIGKCLIDITGLDADKNKFLNLSKNTSNNQLVTQLCSCVEKNIRKEVNGTTFTTNVG